MEQKLKEAIELLYLSTDTLLEKEWIKREASRKVILQWLFENDESE